MTTIIAEVGQNHCGSMAVARHLIRLAKENGADFCKFQLYDHAKLYANEPYVADVSLDYCQAKMLFDCGKDNGIEVFFSVFDLERIEWCERIGVKRYKVAYSEKSNHSLIPTIIQTGKPFYISQGRLRIRWAIYQQDLYCVPQYPATKQDYPLRDLHEYAGISDHTVGLEVAKLAVALDFGIIEKHFAIDHLTGVDAAWSMNPTELKELRRLAG